MQFFQVLATFTLLTLSTHKCLVNSNSAPGDNKAGGNRFNTHLSAVDSGGQPPTPSNHPRYQHIPPHQQQQPHHQQHHSQHQYAGHGGGGGGGGHNMVGSGIHHPSHGAVIGSPHIYHPAPNSGHAEPKNTYNLLSEAMSQAVSNEFSSLGSGSADGACHADDLDCYNDQDRLGMEAIRSLHRQLDDDDNGNIDLSESDDFLREELKYDSGYEKRQKAFHFNDDMHISVKELWEAWLRSEVHNWTTEQTTDWLAQSVQLPQYVDLFKQHKVSGASLPRLAVNNMHYVSNVLGIKDPIHKQKIALKAMDVVLFGPPRETGTRWKDYILVTLLLSAIIGCWYAYQQNKNAKRHLRRMAQDMEGLQRAEQSLQEMQKELERARLEQENVATEKMDLERRLKEVPTLTSSNSDLEVQQLKKEIEMLRTELSRAEIELVDNCWAPPPQLQSWLQYTYELESKNHLKKRVSAEKQLQSAREACEKLRKKRSSLVGAFVSTHGKSIDDVDRSIVEARNSLGEVTNELQERLHRWKQIEQCLGMNIVNNNGLPYLESVLYGRNGGGGSGSSVKSSRARITSSSDDLDDESVQGLIDGYSRNSGLSASTLLNSSSTMGRDDSSGSEDNIESQSVQFYLGNAPPTPMLTAAPAITPRTPLQQAPFEVMNHVGNHNHTNSATVAAIASAAAATAQQQQQQQHASNNDSPLLRSQSSDLMAAKDLYNYLGRPQPLQPFNKNTQTTNGAGAAAVTNNTKAKQMVKQHSTASQQSTSSTSSSVQSTGDQTGKQQSPSRLSTTSLERQIMTQHHHHHQQQQQHHHHHAQIQMQHRQRQDYYEHRRQQDYHHPPPTDYHGQRHHQQQHNQAYEVSRGGAQKYHDHDMEKRKYGSYDQAKDPESLEQDLRSRLLSKRHKYVKDDSAEEVGVARDDSYERLYEEREHERNSKAERRKARRLKGRDAIIEVVDSPDAEENLRHSQRKKHKRHKEKHEKRTALDDIIPPKNSAAIAAHLPVTAEKRRSPEDPELIARRAKLLAAEQEKEKRKEIARKELEARRELRRDRTLDTLSPTAVAASVTAGLNVQIKRKKSDEEEKTKRKRIKKSKDSEEDDDEDVDRDEEDDEDASDSSDDSRDDEEDSVSNSGSDSDHSNYKKSKSKKKKRANHSDGEVSLPESPLSIGELSKSPNKSSKKKAKKKKHSAKSKYSDDEDNEEEEEKHNKRSSRSNSISLSPSRSRSRTRSHTPARSRSRSRSRSSHSSLTASSRSRSRSRSSERSRSRSRSHSSSRSRSRSRTSRSRSLSKSRSRSRSDSRTRSEERDMKANSRKEEKESKDKLSSSEADKRNHEDAEDLPAMDDKGNPLPNYYPGIQGCRSVEEFQCLNRIEEGTYGVVYRAKDKRTNEIVALKRLKMEKEKEGFPITSLREINTLLKGQHPNIVTVREIVVGSNMDKIFIVMDYVEHDLKSLMETMKAKKQSFFPGEIKCLTQQLLRAVGHLHDNWILHRDLKTSNLLLSHKGILKVGDFGLAREYGSPLKKYTSLVVTLWYRAPELLLCSPEYSTPIDIWSVGCIFAEFLQMAPIFPGKSEVDELNRIFKELGTPNEKIWPGYNQLPAVKNMLSQNSQFADYPVSSLRKHFADKTSEAGIDLLQGLLTYDPKQRLSADTALKHQYFKELPVPIDPSMFPTWPAKSELGARKALASSPKPPSGGSQFKQLGKDDLAGTGSGGKIISGIITGNKKTSANTGFVLNAGIDQRQLAMGPGFNLKF